MEVGAKGVRVDRVSWSQGGGLVSVSGVGAERWG